MGLAAVEADPHRHQQPRRVADEPRVAPVVGGAGLAGDGLGGGDAARAGAGAGLDDALQQRGDEVGLGGRDDLHRLGGVVGRHVAVAVADGAHGHGAVRPQPAVGQRQIGAGELERRRLERSERHGGYRGQLAVEAERAGGVDDGGQPNALGDPHGGGVQRVLERAPHGHPALVIVLVVARAPRLVADRDHQRHVVHHRGRRQGGRVVAVLAQRGQVHERLERGARLASRQRRAVVLALRVVATADQRANLAAGRVERDQRRLQAAAGIVAPQARQPRLQPVEAAHHRALGLALQHEIERAVHAGGVAALAEALLELGAHVVGEVRGRLPGRAGRRHAHRLGVGGLPVGGRERAELAHAREHDVAARPRALRIDGGRVAVGPANHPGQQRGLGRRHLVDLLAEVRAGGGADAADGAAVALAEVDLVQVRLEDLRLGVPPLHQRGQPRLAGFAEERAARADQPVLHELLGDGGAALHDAARAQVGPRRAQQPAGVEPAVLEEAVVLGGQHRVDQHQRHLGQPHRAMVLAGPVVGAGEDLGLQRGGADVVAVARHPRDAIVARLDAHALGRPARPAAQVDLPGAAHAPELPGRRRRPVRVGVLQARQRAGQIHAAHVHAGHERLCRGVDERGAPLLDALEAGQGQRGVDDERHQEDDEDGGEARAREPETTAREPVPHGAPVRWPLLPGLRPLGAPHGQGGPPHDRLCPPPRAAGDGKGFSILVGRDLPGPRPAVA